MQPLLQQFQTYLHQRSSQKGRTLKGLGFPKGPTLPESVKEVHTPGMKFQNVTRFVTFESRRSDLNRNARLQAEQGSPAGERSDLVGSKISPSSVKNYISDINHFLTFVSASIQEPIVQPIHITPAAIKAYSAAAAGRLSPSSLNRHLSSLRYFGKFLLAANLSETDPAQNLTNPAFDPTLAQLITRYQKFLQTEDLSKSTIKNYLSDLKKYLLWARKNIKTTDEDLSTRSLI